MSNYDAKIDDVFTLEEWKDYILYQNDYLFTFGKKIFKWKKHSKPKLIEFNELNPLQNRIDDKSIAKFLSDHDYNYIDK